MCPVRRAYFDKFCARARHNVGNAEGASNFDQLAARDWNFLTIRQRIKDEHHGSSIVVHDGGRFTAGEAAKAFLDDGVAVAAATGLQIEFKFEAPRAVSAIASIAPCGSGARPKFVCKTVPVS